MYLAKVYVNFRLQLYLQCTYSVSFIIRMCVYACVCANLRVASQFHKVFFNLFFKSKCTYCVSYLMWNRVPCSHGSM